MIEGEGRPLSMQEIHEIAAGQSPGLGLRTAYRVVNRLLEDEVISMVAMNGQQVRYELAEIAKSRNCGRRTQISSFDVLAQPSIL